jgi:polyisoprenoid-binding protein YceI
MSSAGVSDLRAALATADAKLREAAGLDGEEILRWTSFNGEAMAFPRWVLVNQAVHHATEHRAQIAGSLAAHGVTAIDLDAIDVWTYFEA